MKEHQAEQKGYRFTGDYERSKETIKERCEEYKKEGYKVIICEVPDSPLSKGGVGVGYSIHAEPKYFINREIKDINKRLSFINKRKEDALNEYNRKLAEINYDKEKMEDRLRELTDNSQDHIEQ